MERRAMEQDELVALSDRGYYALTREITARSGGEVLEEDGLLMVASASHPASFIVNETMRLDAGVSAEAAQRHNGRPVALQSSPMARPLYQRIGFQAVTAYQLWEDHRPE